MACPSHFYIEVLLLQPLLFLNKWYTGYAASYTYHTHGSSPNIQNAAIHLVPFEIPCLSEMRFSTLVEILRETFSLRLAITAR